MRVLLLTGSPSSYMAPPRLGDEQIVGGPDWPDARAADGRWLSVSTPRGEYDLAAVLAKLPMDEWPDVVACLVDASWRNLPRGLAGFRGPKVLLVADTHHLQSPLITMIRYAATEPYDRIAFLYDRHHAGIFQAAGFRNLFWLPGLTFPHDDSAFSDPKAPRLAQIAFVGQAGKHHPRRGRLLDALRAARLPLRQQQLGQREALAFYGSSLLGFNASLNGDLNLRTFEILAAGALLLTDRLAPDSGFDQLLADGRECVLYGSEAELTERAAHWLRHPREAQALAAAGQDWFRRTLGAERRRELFRTVALDGAAPEPFLLTEAAAPAVSFADTDQLLAATMVYEGVQELHRTQEQVTVALDPHAPAGFAALCRTLPRVQLAPVDAAGADLAVVSALDASAAAVRGVPRLWCWDANAAQVPELDSRLAAAGYASASRDVVVYCRDEHARPGPTPDEVAAQARQLLQRGDYNGALELGRQAFNANPDCLGALTVLADLALLKENGALAEKLLRSARELAPRDAAVAAALGEALLVQKKFSEADATVSAALKLNPAQVRALTVLARLREAQGRPAEVVAALRQMLRYYPESADAAARLGQALRRQGDLLEGLAWQRRALGVRDAVPPLDPASRPVRVAFIVQHPQGWTSLESVWRALREDERFAPVIIAAPYQHPYPTEGGPDAIFSFLAKEDIPHVRWDRADLRPGFADIVFVQNPYDVTRPAPLHVANLLRLVPRLAYVPYGLEIGGGERNNTMVMNMPLQQSAWLVCARSERQRQAYAKHCLTGNAHVAVTGHAKLDPLRDLSRIDTAELDRFAAGRRLVGWNPHFDLRPKAGSRYGEGFSTFLRWWEQVLAEFAHRPELALVIRPHPLLFGTLEARRIWTPAQTQDFLRRAAATGNVLIDRSASYLPLFARTDAMLSDASSFILEYGATGKPLLYLHNPDGPGLNDDGDFVRDHLAWAEQDEDLARFLDDVAAGRDPRGEARRRAFPDYMHQPPEGVGRAVKQAILDRLAAELPAPACVLAAS